MGKYAYTHRHKLVSWARPFFLTRAIGTLKKGLVK